MTLAELLDTVYRYYPRRLYVDSPGYDETEAHRRLVKAVRRGVAEYPEWRAMMQRLGERYRLWNESLYLLGGTLGPAYSAHVDVPGGRKVGFHVCFLGPYYGIHRTGHPGEEPAVSDLGREIEATYVGYEPIPPELGDVIVPDVALDCRDFGTATIYECLLSTVWKYSSGPCGDPKAGS